MTPRPTTVLFSLCIATVLTAGCARTAPPTSADPATPPAYREIALMRYNAITGDRLTLTIAPDGVYRIQNTGKAGQRTATSGTLTPKQRNRIEAAFAGWEKLEEIYPYPGGSFEELHLEIRQGDKRVIASDGALNVPRTVRDVYAGLREVILDAGLF